LLPQVIPAGLLLTVPASLLFFVTLRVKAGDEAVFTVNVAVTAVLELSFTVHIPMPVQPPPQLENTEPLLAVAVSATLVALGKLAEHLLPQVMPAGLLLTVPLPVPFFVTLSVKFCADPLLGLKVAVTVMLELSVTVQLPVPEHPPPLQPENTERSLATAVRLTCVPPGKLAEQVVPQVMPAGLLLTVPLPVPDFVTFRLTPAGVAGAVPHDSLENEELPAELYALT
jgi:hypothetical protein